MTIKTSGQISFADLRAEYDTGSTPGPSAVLLPYTAEDGTAGSWISPVTGTIYVTVVGGGGASANSGGVWDTGHDSGGGAGGGSGGEIIYRSALNVTAGQAIQYKYLPTTYYTVWDETGGGGGQSGEPTYGVWTNMVAAPVTEFNGIVPRLGEQGYPSNRYSGGIGSVHFYGGVTGNPAEGGNGGNSIINSIGNAGFAGGVNESILDAARRGAGGAGGSSGTDFPGSKGKPGYGYGAGAGGWHGTRGSDGDQPGGGGGGAGGFIPPGTASNFLAPGVDTAATDSSANMYFGAAGCIYIEFQASYGGGSAGTGPISFQDYTRGGIFVPATAAAAAASYQTAPLTPVSNIQVSTAMPLQLSMFYGQQDIEGNVAPPPPPPPPPASYYPGGTGVFDAFGGSPNTTARATLTLLPDGSATSGGTGNTTRTNRWLTGTNGSAHEVSWEMHPNSADYPSVTGGGEAPAWRAMSTNWVAQITDADSLTTAHSIFYLRIREIANPANAVEYIVELEADGECFAVGTMVRTSTGDRTVESLVDGDELVSFVESTMIDEGADGWRDWKIASLENVRTDATATVRGKTQFTRSRSVKINGIHSTLTHTYFVFDGEQYGWKIARDITISDSLVNVNLNLEPVTSIEQVTESTEFVALNVEDLDTLQVKSGDTYILAHNVSA